MQVKSQSQRSKLTRHVVAIHDHVVATKQQSSHVFLSIHVVAAYVTSWELNLQRLNELSQILQFQRFQSPDLIISNVQMDKVSTFNP